MNKNQGIISNVTEETEGHNNHHRNYIINAAFDTVWYGLITYPFQNYDNYDKHEKYRLFDSTMGLLEQLTAKELVLLFEGDEDEYDEDILSQVTELTGKYGNKALGNYVLKILYDYEHGIWYDFFYNLMEVSDYVAKETGISNVYDEFRRSMGIPDYWEVNC